MIYKQIIKLYQKAILHNNIILTPMQSTSKLSNNQFTIQYTYYQQIDKHLPKKSTLQNCKKQSISTILSKNNQQISKQEFNSDNGSCEIQQKLRRNKAVSSEQIGISQRNVFQTKIRIMKKIGISYKGLYGQVPFYDKIYQKNIKQIDSHNEQKRLNFIQKYKQNLQKTYNQTKLMIQQQSNKNRQSSCQTLKSARSAPSNRQIQQNNKKNSLQGYLKRKNSKKLSNIDILYKTIINNNRIRVRPSQQLDISKFPIIKKNKRQQSKNFSNLLNHLNMRQKDLKQQQQVHFKKYTKKIEKRCISRGSRGSIFQKHQIQPWETFTDQFIE